MRARVFIGDHYLSVCLLNKSYKVELQDKIYFYFDEKSFLNSLFELISWLKKYTTHCSIEWILGIKYVKFLVLPWSLQLRKEKFTLMLARQMFNKSFQQDSNMMEIKLNAFGYGQGVLATYIDITLIEQIKRLTDGTKFRNMVIEPLVSVVWNRYYSRIKKINSSIYVIENNRVFFIEQKRGCIIKVGLLPYSENNIAELNRMAENKLIFDPKFFFEKEAPIEYLICKDNRNDVYKELDFGYAYPLCGIL